MSQEGEKRRIFLFKNFGKFIKVNYNNQLKSYVELNLGEEPPKGEGWAEFNQVYFNDEQGVLKFFEDAKKVYNSFTNEQDKKTVQSWVGKVDLRGNNPKNLFVYYACDLGWAQSTNYCFDGQLDLNLLEFVGLYEDDTKKIEANITDKNGLLKATLFGYEMDLVNVAKDEFKIEIDLSSFNIPLGRTEIGKVNFTRDTITNGINGLDYSLANIPSAYKSFLGNIPTSAHLNKWKKDYTSDTKSSGLDLRYFKGKTSDFYDFGKTNKKKQNDYRTNLEKRMVHLNDAPEKIKMPENIHECDENADNWEIGCKNKKIAEINKWVLGNEQQGVLSQKTLDGLHSQALLKTSENKVPNSIYLRLKAMNLQESIIKNVVIKNLNELIKQKK